jgi:hypothetical protein
VLHSLGSLFEVSAIFTNAFCNYAPADQKSEDLATEAVSEHGLQAGGEDETSENDICSFVQPQP